jgi:hypothetical protein
MILTAVFMKSHALSSCWIPRVLLAQAQQVRNNLQAGAKYKINSFTVLAVLNKSWYNDVQSSHQ